MYQSMQNVGLSSIKFGSKVFVNAMFDDDWCFMATFVHKVG